MSNEYANVSPAEQREESAREARRQAVRDAVSPPPTAMKLSLIHI